MAPVLLAAAVLYALAITILSASSFYIASGSDSGVHIYTSSVPLKAITLLAIAVAWSGTVLVRRVRPWQRWSLGIAGLVALALATHVVSFNYKRGVLEEHWLLWRVDRANFNIAEGMRYDWAIEPVAFGIELTHLHNKTRRFVFTGIPPWNVDLEPSLRDQ